MRISALIPLAAAIMLSAVLIAIADAHSWSDTAAQGALSAIIGGTAVINILFAYWQEGRLRIRRQSRRRARRMT